MPRLLDLISFGTQEVGGGYDDEADDEDDDDSGHHEQDGGGDIYIMMSVCLSVTKNHHFLLGVSCDHLNYP